MEASRRDVECSPELVVASTNVILQVCVWNLADGCTTDSAAQVLSGHPAAVTCVTASASAVWSGGQDGVLFCWRASAHSLAEGYKVQPHSKSINDVLALGVCACQAACIRLTFGSLHMLSNVPEVSHQSLVNMHCSDSLA